MMTKPRPPAARRPARGFTLIELMIAVAIVAIIGAVALPAFLDSMRKSRRTEAFSAIAAVQQAQERHRSNNNSFAADLATLGIASATTAPGGYYTLAVSGASGTQYTVAAVAVSGKSQASDGDCARLAARVNGGQITYASCATCSTFTFAESNACWKR